MATTFKLRAAASAVALIALLLLAGHVRTADAGPGAGLATYASCQSGCNVAAAACYASAGFVFGVLTLGMGAPAAAAACSAQQGVCMAACAAMAGIATLTPTA